MTARTPAPRAQMYTDAYLITKEAARAGLAMVEEDESTLVPAPWARLELPEGCWCAPPPDPDAVDPFSFPGDLSVEGVEALDDEAWSEDRPLPWEMGTRLVLFLPDGAAVSTRRFGVRTREGWRPVEIEPYGGRPVVGEVFDPEAAEFALEDPEVGDRGDEPDWEDDWRQDAGVEPDDRDAVAGNEEIPE